MEYPDRISTERASIRPPLAEGKVQVSNGRAFDRYLDVVPGWGLPIQRRHRLALRVAEMACIIAAAVTEVDPAHKGNVGCTSSATADDDELLVVGAAETHALVEKYFAPGRIHHHAKVAVLFSTESEPVRV